MAPATAENTVVHLLRHGEVENPDGILYGRLPGYHLSETGRKMAATVADELTTRDVTVLYCSPLDRARETAAPIAAAFDLEVRVDDRLIEADNVFEGHSMGVGDGALRSPRAWRHLWNPFRPSWGEPYNDVVRRMMSIIAEARREAHGHEAVLVSHQLPIWVTRLAAERRRLWHDPRRRQCALASLTSLAFEDGRLMSVGYSEPAGGLARRAPDVRGA